MKIVFGLIVLGMFLGQGVVAQVDMPWVGWYWARYDEMRSAVSTLDNFAKQCDRQTGEGDDGPYYSKKFNALIDQVSKAGDKAQLKFPELKGIKDAFKGCYENPGPDYGGYVVKECADPRIKEWSTKFQSARKEAYRRANIELDENGDPTQDQKPGAKKVLKTPGRRGGLSEPAVNLQENGPSKQR